MKKNGITTSPVYFSITKDCRMLTQSSGIKIVEFERKMARTDILRISKEYRLATDGVLDVFRKAWILGVDGTSPWTSPGSTLPPLSQGVLSLVYLHLP